MNKINNLPFPNYNISLKGVNKKSSKTDDSINNCLESSNEYMSSDVSSAARAYGLSFINQNKTIPQMSLKNMIKWLEAQGKVEGKDFEIDSSCSLGNISVILKNKNGQEELFIHYDEGNISTWSGYDVSEYTNGKLTKQTGRDSNGNISSQIKVLGNNDTMVPFLKKECLLNSTSPEEYIKHLEENNIAYSIEHSDNEQSKQIYIRTFNDNNQVAKETTFYYGKNSFKEPCKFIIQSDINSEGNEYRRLGFYNDCVEVITYTNGL